MHWRNLLLILLFCGISAVLAQLFFDFLIFQDDSGSYLNAIRIMAGQPGEHDRLQRLIKPFSLLIPASLLYLNWLNAAQALLFQQGLCFVFSAVLIFLISKTLFQNATTALLGVAIYLSCQTVVIYGSVLMMDGMGWFMELLCIYVGLRLFEQQQHPPLLQYLGLGLLMGISFYVKETVLMAGLWVLVYHITKRTNWSLRLQQLTSMGVGFLVIVGIVTIYTQYQYQQSMLSWFLFNHSDPKQYRLDLYAYALQSFRSLDLHWLLIIWGVYLHLRKKSSPSPVLHSFLITAILGFIAFPWLWVYRSDRILFMIALFLIPFAAKGAAYFGRWGWILVILSGGMSLFMTWRIYAYRESGWLWIMLGSFAGIFLLLLFLDNHKHRKVADRSV